MTDKTVKLLQVTISGYYKTANKNEVDFDNVTGIMPYVEEEFAFAAARNRYVWLWVQNATRGDGSKKYPQRMDATRQTFIDDIKEIHGKPLSYVGKDIKEMSYDELQDLAVANDLRTVPLPKTASGSSLREMREAAYLAYHDVVLGRKILTDAQKNPSYNYAKLPPLIADGHINKDDAEKVSNEEVLAKDENGTVVNSAPEGMSLGDLKNLADTKGISYHPSIGYQKLYDKVFA
jgi:hypothetical protein